MSYGIVPAASERPCMPHSNSASLGRANHSLNPKIEVVTRCNSSDLRVTERKKIKEFTYPDVRSSAIDVVDCVFSSQHVVNLVARGSVASVFDLIVYDMPLGDPQAL